MNLIEIKHHVGNIERTLEDNPLTMWGIILAVVLVVLFFGGLFLESFLTWQRAREKAKAVERLHKYIQSAPSPRA